MRKSVLQPQWVHDGRIPVDAECYVCNKMGLDTKAQCVHHVYGGPLRKVSDRNGFWVYLCHKHHNLSNFGVHFDRELDRKVKEDCQRAYEQENDRASFMALVGKNYLEGE